ncbi:MAG: hypothetical protein IKW90_11450 [Lachnospiraceae bacterium]|nr:hypothetical protein [Lachnospiraceae bacterium]MBR6383509.1 hypothetical protein [Lachnospiraceae bacterium]
MSVTVAEFAAQRGMTRQGVYKAMKRFNIPTFQGVSNGKSTQFMSDEDAQKLNEMLGPTEASNLILKQNLELQIQQDREKLIQEKADKVEAVLREKEQEVMTTRQQMLEHIDSSVSEMREIAEAERNGTIKLYENQVKDLKKEKQALMDKVEALTAENSELKETINKLNEMLVEAVNHPYRHLINTASHIDEYKPFERGKKNGKPHEND